MEKYQQAVSFHGHSCPGLAIGYRVAQVAMRELISNRSEDEELVAVVENSSCAVDAIQFITGCTFGKGNFHFLDYGKNVYTFFNRKNNSGIRIYAEPFSENNEFDRKFMDLRTKKDLSEQEKQEMSKLVEEKTDNILNMPEKDLIKISKATIPLPAKATIFQSIRCDICMEKAMEGRIKNIDGKKTCLDCKNKS